MPGGIRRGEMLLAFKYALSRFLNEGVDTIEHPIKARGHNKIKNRMADLIIILLLHFASLLLPLDGACCPVVKAEGVYLL